MAKHCSNCGAEVTEGAKFCEYCGHNLAEDEVKPSSQTNAEQASAPRAEQSSAPKSDGDFDNFFVGINVGDKQGGNATGGTQNGTPNYSPDYYAQNGADNQAFMASAEGGISSSLGNGIANKTLKDIRGWSIFLLIISALRFLTSVSGFSDLGDMKNSLAALGQRNLESFVTYEALFYVEFALIVVLFASSIALLVLANVCYKDRFPLQNQKRVEMLRFSGIAALVYAIAVVVFIVVEVFAFINILQLYKDLDITDFNTVSVFSLVFTIILLVGAIASSSSSFKLYKSCEKQK